MPLSTCPVDQPAKDQTTGTECFKETGSPLPIRDLDYFLGGCQDGRLFFVQLDVT